jgi:hypothetical protein
MTTIAVIALSAGCQTIAPRHEPKTLSLSGSWFLHLDPNNAGENEKWYDSKLTDSIELPGSTTENGYGDDVSVDTEWTGSIIDKSWFTEAKYEKYRQADSVKIPFWLTPLKHYVGPAW